MCLATSGPGATNLVTGIANAYLDSVPMVAITGQVARPFIGKDAFQEIDITGITLPITKHNYLVMDTARPGEDVSRRRFIWRVPAGRARCSSIYRRTYSVEQAEFRYPDKVDLPGYKPDHPGIRRRSKRPPS